MPIIPLDLTGERYGRLVVLYEVEPAVSKGHRDRRWMCQCDCGNTKIILQGSMRSGKTTSCDCYHKEVMKAPYDINSSEYHAWLGMKSRCKPSKVKGWKCYQDKQTKVCNEWQDDFLAFLDHIGPKPSPLHSVDRIEGSKDYEPGNVRWSDKRTQVLNRDCTVMITYKGETKPLSVWAEEKGFKVHQLYVRIKVSGWSIERALETPLGPQAKSPSTPQPTE